MTTANTQPSTTIQTVHAALIWATLAGMEGIAQFYLRPLPKTMTFYYAALGLTAFVWVLVHCLGKSAIARDIQTICFYDVILQLMACLLFENGYHDSWYEWYVALAQMIIILKLLRLAWPVCSTRLGLPPYWPPFGLLGWLRLRRASNPTTIYTSTQRRKFYWLLACILPIGYLTQVAWLKGNIPLPGVIVVVAALWSIKRLIATLEAREQEHRQTEHALGEAMGREQAKQEYITTLTAQKAEVERQAAELAAINLELDNKNTALAATNAELDRKNAALAALYNERDAMAQNLAARNDKLADATHDLKTAMVPMTYKIDAIATSATSATQRADAIWLLAETQRIALKMQQIIHDAKISNPLPPLAEKSPLPIHLLCDYLCTRFNQMAVEGNGIDLFFENKAGDQATLQVNEEELKDILANLIINALKYGKQWGKVRVVFLAAPGCHHVLVWDNGPGIPGYAGKNRKANFTNFVEELAKVQYFKRRAAHANNAPSRTEPGGSNGLGILNLKRTCRALGIAIGFHSVVGRGTCFRLTIPLNR
jgi:signal transduction histidine kinase